MLPTPVGQPPGPRASFSKILLAAAVVYALVVLSGMLDSSTPSPAEAEAPAATTPTGEQPSNARKFLAEYGGDLGSYERILGLSDCASLQAEFDQAADNNERYEGGEPLFRVTLGYMTAADERMELVGCYD